MGVSTSSLSWGTQADAGSCIAKERSQSRVSMLKGINPDLVFTLEPVAGMKELAGQLVAFVFSKCLQSWHLPL